MDAGSMRRFQMRICGRVSDAARRMSLPEQEQPFLLLFLELVWRQVPSSCLFHNVPFFEKAIPFLSMVIFLLDKDGWHLVSWNRLYTITQYLLSKFLQWCYPIFIGTNMLLKQRPKTCILRFTKTEFVGNFI